MTCPPSISHQEAQEMHRLIGVTYETVRYMPAATLEMEADLRRAREIAAIVVSDTDPLNNDAG